MMVLKCHTLFHTFLSSLYSSGVCSTTSPLLFANLFESRVMYYINKDSTMMMMMMMMMMVVVVVVVVVVVIMMVEGD
jgi:hypothetical protein